MSNTTPLQLAVILLTSSGCAFAADWNPSLAAHYLDSRQKEWSAWAPAAAPGGTCFSCHTSMTYLFARPALRHALGESEPTPYEKGLLDGLRARVDKRDARQVSRSFTKEPLASQAMGVESIFAALFLARGDRHNSDQAFDRLWELQLHDGKSKGAWPWFQLALDPWEMPESGFYGASLAAMAVGHAPAEYRARPEVREHVADLTAYLRADRQSQPLHNRLMLLWASASLPDLVAESASKALIDETIGKQQADGGWTIASLGPFQPHPQAAESAGSNAYATGFATFVMLQAGVPRSNPAIVRAVEWLRSRQDPSLGCWEATSMNKHFEPGSMQDQFMRDAATSFAVLALLEAEDRH